MARKKRDADPGIFHVSTHSVWTGVLFRDDVDRMHFVTELAETASKLGWSCMCVSVLTTHYHLLVETFDKSLSQGMKHLNLSHATRFNARHKLRGHVVDGRFLSDRVKTEAHLLAVFRYISLNASEAGICGSPAEWPWCSYRGLVEPVETFTFVDVSRVLGCWSPGGATVKDLRRFVEKPWLTGPGV
jgi:REP element-mobilizing transposase RayT